MLMVQVGHVIGSCRSRVAGCLDCVIYLSFVESLDRVCVFMHFPVDFAGGGVLPVGFEF